MSKFDTLYNQVVNEADKKLVKDKKTGEMYDPKEVAWPIFKVLIY